MNIAALQSNARPDNVPIEQLSGNAALSEKEKVAEVARQFEAILLRKILAETQKTVIPSKFSDNSTTADIYRDMVTNQLADSISKSGAVGLASALERQLDRQVLPHSQAGDARPADASPTSPSEKALRPGSFPPSGARIPHAHGSYFQPATSVVAHPHK